MKTKALIGVLLFASATFLSVGCTENTPKPNSAALFQNPTNEAQRLVNAVATIGKTARFNVGSEAEGTSYRHKLYARNNVYELEVYARNNGEKSLHINFYLTNQPLEDMKTPADLVAQEIMYGRSEMYIEEHLSDYGVDMGVDIYQTFEKKVGDTWRSFTREERDSKASGVQEYLYRDGQEFKNGSWKAVPEKTTNEITGYYKELLVEILAILEKNNRQ